MNSARKLCYLCYILTNLPVPGCNVCPPSSLHNKSVPKKFKSLTDATGIVHRLLSPGAVVWKIGVIYSVSEY